MKDLPQVGQFVRARGRNWLVESGLTPIDALRNDSDAPPVVTLSCVDEDASGATLDLLWPAELDTQILPVGDWQTLGTGGVENASTFAAYLKTVKWNTATATDPALFQAPFRAGIKLDAYQLEPLRKALALPRVNLLIADDVGLGKTVESGLIVRELLLRRRIDFVVVAAPPSMTLQWQEELETKFGLSFTIVDRENLEAVLEARGEFANGPGESAVDRIFRAARRRGMVCFIQNQQGLRTELSEKILQAGRIIGVDQQLVTDDEP